jgi:hypothetical protein
MSKDNIRPFKPLVEGINRLNLLESESDLWFAFLDISICLEDGIIKHDEATERLSACVGICLAKNNIKIPFIKE